MSSSEELMSPSPDAVSKLASEAMSTSEQPTSSTPAAPIDTGSDPDIPAHLRSWVPGVRSIDDIVPPPSDFVIAKRNEKPKPDEPPKPKDFGKNRGLKASTLRQLNVRLRRYGPVMKRIVPLDVDPVLGLQSNAENIQSSGEIAEYEIVGMNGESKDWVANQLAIGADEDKAERLFKEQVEKEKAEKEAAADDEEEEDRETAIGSASEDDCGKEKGRKRTGSGPPLGVFYEPIVPASDDEGGK